MYWSPKQFSLRMQDILLVFYIKINTYHTSMKFTSTFTWFMFYKCLWFTYHFYRVYIFHSLRTQIHARITDPVTLIHTNDEWIVMTFTRNYINKSWSDHAWLIIQGLKHNNQWSNNDLPFFILASKHFFCWFVELGLISKTVISGFFFNLCLWRLYSKNPWWLD